MGTTQIRIELEDDVYRILTDEQSKRKAIAGKKPPLSELILEYFTTGLQVKLSGINSINDEQEQNVNPLHSIVDVQHKALELTQKENILKDREKEAISREEGLRYREKDLYEQLNDLYERKDEMIEQREESFEKIADIGIQKAEFEFLKKVSMQKDEEILQMKADIIYYKDKLLKQLETLENKLDRKPDSNFVRDWGIPALASIIGVANNIKANKNNKSIKLIQDTLLNSGKALDKDLIDNSNSITSSKSKKKVLPPANTGGVS